MRLFQFAMRFNMHHSSFPARTVRSWSSLLLIGLLILGGCANLSEKRTITSFQSGIESGNLDLLHTHASPHFASKALRHPAADDAIEQLKLPEGDFKILNVEDVSETEKKVTVGFGKEHKRKIMYRLVQQDKKDGWKVDDIYLRQRSGRKTIVMPVTEQLDVLLSGREFFESWSQGDRQRVLKSCSPELAMQLEKLPPAVLAYNISLIIGKAERTKSFRPEAHINGDKAVVKLNRSHGTIQISMEKDGTSWQISDLALMGRNEDSRVESLLSRVKMINHTMAFLDAWQQEDKQKLKQITRDKFYTSGLAPAKLSDIALPASYEVEGKVDVKLSDSRADVILNDQKQTLQVTLKQNKEESEEYKITDVTLYDMQNEKNLSLVSALTARPVAELFMRALSQRDRKMLQYNSTNDFHSKTWGRASKQTLAIVPMPVKNVGTAHVVDTKFNGEVTYVTFEAGNNLLTVELHDQAGRVLVDDVAVKPKSPGTANLAQTVSLKENLAATIPVYELAANIHNNQPKQTLRLVTDDFYNRVFSLTSQMPETAYTYLNHISATLPRVENPKPSSVETEKNQRKTKANNRNLVVAFDTSGEREVTVTFNSPASEMQVKLIEEDGLLRVSDALISTPQNPVAQHLKQAMRMELAQQRTNNAIRTVSAEQRSTPLRMNRLTPAQPSPLQLPGTTKRIPRAMNDNPQPGRHQVSKNPLPDKPMMKNALYEEYQQETKPQAIQQTDHRLGLPNEKSTPPVPPKRLNPEVLLNHQQLENQLLLKEIPTE